MTRDEEKLLSSLKSLGKVPMIIEPATVKSVDLATLTCVVELPDETEIPDVRLKAAIDNVKDGMVQVPAVNSTVLVGLIGNKVSTRCVVMVSVVEEVLFFNGTNGGLVKWQSTKTELDKVKDYITAINNVLNGAPIAEPGGGAPSALQTSLKAAVTGIQMPSFEDLENTKVKH